MNQIIFYAQTLSALVLIALIAIQQRGTALGSAFGGSGDFYANRRGIQKNIYYATIAIAIIFLTLSVANVIL